MNLNTVMLGDALELIKDIPDKSVDVTFTSPPYNRMRNDVYEHFEDRNDNYEQFLIDITNECLRITRERVIVNVQQNCHNKEDVFSFIGHFATKIQGIVIWTKNNPQPSSNYREVDNSISVGNAYEMFIFISDNPDEFRAYGSDFVFNHISSNVNSQHIDGHGAVMKQSIADYFIDKFTKEGQIVFDPFMGTGTTAVSCIKYHRYFLGCEICPDYIRTCERRIKEAEKSPMMRFVWD